MLLTFVIICNVQQTTGMADILAVLCPIELLGDFVKEVPNAIATKVKDPRKLKLKIDELPEHEYMELLKRLGYDYRPTKSTLMQQIFPADHIIKKRCKTISERMKEKGTHVKHTPPTTPQPRYLKNGRQTRSGTFELIEDFGLIRKLPWACSTCGLVVRASASKPTGPHEKPRLPEQAKGTVQCEGEFFIACWKCSKCQIIYEGQRPQTKPKEPCKQCGGRWKLSSYVPDKPRRAIKPRTVHVPRVTKPTGMSVPRRRSTGTPKEGKAGRRRLESRPRSGTGIDRLLRETRRAQGLA